MSRTIKDYFHCSTQHSPQCGAFCIILHLLNKPESQLMLRVAKETKQTAKVDWRNVNPKLFGLGSPWSGRVIAEAKLAHGSFADMSYHVNTDWVDTHNAKVWTKWHIESSSPTTATPKQDAESSSELETKACLDTFSDARSQDAHSCVPHSCPDLTLQMVNELKQKNLKNAIQAFHVANNAQYLPQGFSSYYSIEKKQHLSEINTELNSVASNPEGKTQVQSSSRNRSQLQKGSHSERRLLSHSQLQEENIWLRSERKWLQLENEKLKSERSKLQKLWENLRVQRDELESERDALQDEQAQIQSERDLLRPERDQLVFERNRLLIMRSRLETERTELICERNQLKCERDQAILDRDRLNLEKEHLLAERDKFKLERNEVQFTCEQLRSSQDQSQSVYDQLKQERDAFGSEIAELRKQKGQIECIQQQYKLERDQLDIECTELQSNLDKLQDQMHIKLEQLCEERNQLRRQLSEKSIEQDQSQRDLTRLGSETVKLQNKIIEFEAERNTLSGRLHALEKTDVQPLQSQEKRTRGDSSRKLRLPRPGLFSRLSFKRDKHAKGALAGP